MRLKLSDVWPRRRQTTVPDLLTAATGDEQSPIFGKRVTVIYQPKGERSLQITARRNGSISRIAAYSGAAPPLCRHTLVKRAELNPSKDALQISSLDVKVHSDCVRRTSYGHLVRFNKHG